MYLVPTYQQQKSVKNIYICRTPCPIIITCINKYIVSTSTQCGVFTKSNQVADLFFFFWLQRRKNQSLCLLSVNEVFSMPKILYLSSASSYIFVLHCSVKLTIYHWKQTNCIMHAYHTFFFHPLHFALYCPLLQAQFALNWKELTLQHKLAMKATAPRAVTIMPQRAADVNYLCLHTVTVAMDWPAGEEYGRCCVLTQCNLSKQQTMY